MWNLVEGKLIKQVGDINYVIEFKPALEQELLGEWVAYRQECGLVQVELVSSEKLERCIHACNKDML